MSATEPKIPGPDHPITIERSPSRVAVSVGDHRIAESTDALVLREAGYPPVYYLPLSDLDHSVLRDSDTTTWCPYKGTASYYSVDVGEGLVPDVVWYYPAAHEAVAQITDHAAFYADRARIEVEAAR